LASAFDGGFCLFVEPVAVEVVFSLGLDSWLLPLDALVHFYAMLNVPLNNVKAGDRSTEAFHPLSRSA